MTKAESDLANATLVISVALEGQFDTVCFHAQQCVEKYIKALIVVQGAIVPKTHNLRKLISLLPRGFQPTLTVDEQNRLSLYAIEPRYPGAAEIGQAEARDAVRIARRVRTQVRRMLPRRALVGPKRPAATHPNSRHPR
ncbi:MAG: HEPN domain-containing protein [SAR324 cluster bacterium]